MAVTENRYLALEEEGSWGDESKTAPANYIDFIKESFSSNRNTNVVNTVGHIEARTASIGKYKAGGGLVLQAVPDELGHFIRMLMGAAFSSVKLGATDAYWHLFYPKDVIPNYTIAICKDGLLRRYISSTMKKMVVKMVPGQDAQITCDIVASKDMIGTKQVPTYTTKPQPLSFTGWDFKLGGVNVYPLGVEYTFERALDEDDYRCESQFIKACHARGFKSTIKCDLKFEDETELKRFYNGTTGTEPGDVVTPFGCATVLEGVEADTGENYHFDISHPAVEWDTEKAQMDEKKAIIQNLTGVAIHSITAGFGTRIYLKNLDTDLT